MTRSLASPGFSRRRPVAQRRTQALVCGLTLLFGCSGRGEDAALQALDEVRRAYEQRQFQAALEAINTATEAIANASAQQLVDALPEPPDTWAADPATSHTAPGTGSARMVSTRRGYRSPSGGRVTVAIEANSPMLQSFAMVFTNPMMLQASGAQLETVQGQAFALNYRGAEKKGEAKSIVAERYLVVITGENVSREELLAFARALKRDELEAKR